MHDNQHARNIGHTVTMKAQIKEVDSSIVVIPMGLMASIRLRPHTIFTPPNAKKFISQKLLNVFFVSQKLGVC